MVGDATEMACKYLRDRKHMPTEEELLLLNQLAETLCQNHATAQYIVRNMHGRSSEAAFLKRWLPLCAPRIQTLIAVAQPVFG